MNTYRLPNESEWELAAGHMPKDADFNCGVNDGRTSVEEYAKVTRGAHGAVDFWGNVWEWTTTVRSDSTLGVKGDAWDSARTDCRTEHRKEGRAASQGYKDVGFRVFKILNGEEPAQKVEFATLQAPIVAAISTEPGSITLSWQAVEGATAYQLFSYDADANHIEMLGTTEETSAVMDGLAPGTYRYIVQPISYVEIADNVSGEYSVGASCGNAPEAAVLASAGYDAQADCLTLSWEAADGAETYYIYRYHPDANMLSTPKVVSGKSSYSYRKTASDEYNYLVTTEPMSSRKYYDGSGALCVRIPDNR